MKIQKHDGLNDWCHVCGRRSDHTADVWYPENAEDETDKRNAKYVRICVRCATSIAIDAAGGFPSFIAWLEQQFAASSSGKRAG